MADLIAVEPEEEYNPPSYSKKGWILVEILSIDDSGEFYSKYEVNVLNYDHGSSVVWLQEGVGIDYFCNTYCEFPAIGIYLIMGVHGEYIKGEWGFTDDDENWYFKRCRLATKEEIVRYGDTEANTV